MKFLSRVQTVVLGLAVLFGFGGATPLLVTSPAYAASTTQSEVCESIGGCKTAKDSNLTKVITFVVNMLGVIAGFVAVVMVILSGYKYMTAAGDSSKVASAKNTLIYAIIGIIIVVLSQFIVQFVIGKSANAVGKATQIQVVNEYADAIEYNA